MCHAHRVEGAKELVSQVCLQVYVKQAVQRMTRRGTSVQLFQMPCGPSQINGTLHIVKQQSFPGRSIGLMKEPACDPSIRRHLSQGCHSSAPVASHRSREGQESPAEGGRNLVEPTEQIHHAMGRIR